MAGGDQFIQVSGLERHEAERQSARVSIASRAGIAWAFGEAGEQAADDLGDKLGFGGGGFGLHGARVRGGVAGELPRLSSGIKSASKEKLAGAGSGGGFWGVGIDAAILSPAIQYGHSGEGVIAERRGDSVAT